MPYSFRSVLVLAVLLGAAALLEWRFVPNPPTPKAMALAEEPVDLMRTAKPQLDKALQILDKGSLWGKLPEPEAQTSPIDPPWRFVGTMARGTERYVLVKVEGQPEKQLTIGDTLPGGSKILKIDGDTLCLFVNGKKRSIGLYPQGPQAL